MKKILSIIFLVALVASAFGQVRTAPVDFTVSRNYYEYTGVAGDTAVSGTDSNIDFAVSGIKGLKLFRVEAELDEISGSANCIAILQGSLNGQDFFEIDTLANTAGVEAQSANATVLLEDKSAGVLYRYFRIVQAVSTTGKWDLNYLRVYMWGKND